MKTVMNVSAEEEEEEERGAYGEDARAHFPHGHALSVCRGREGRLVEEVEERAARAGSAAVGYDDELEREERGEEAALSEPRGAEDLSHAPQVCDSRFVSDSRNSVSFQIPRSGHDRDFQRTRARLLLLFRTRSIRTTREQPRDSSTTHSRTPTSNPQSLPPTPVACSRGNSRAAPSPSRKPCSPSECNESRAPRAASAPGARAKIFVDR